MLTSEQAISKVAFRERSLDITRDLGRVNLDDLKGEVEETGAESIWWGVLAAQAQADAERAKLRVEVTKAELGRKVRNESALRNEKTTERGIEEAIILDDVYKNAMESQITAFEKAGTLSAVRFAVDRKQKTLEGLTHLLAAELQARAAGTRMPSPEEKLRERMRDQLAAVPPARGRRRAVVAAEPIPPPTEEAQPAARPVRQAVE